MAAAPAVAETRERVALIDLGDLGDPGDLGPDSGRTGRGAADIARQLRAAITAAGFDLVAGDGIEEALAGRDVERDAVALADAMAAAERAFGALACGEAARAAHQAIGIAAARQAAGRPVPDLARAWTYVLLCADREGQLDAALAAAGQLRALGGSPDVPAAVWAKYPEIDAVAGRDLVELDIEADVAGAAIWIDFRPVGTSPVHVELPAGEHVIAAAAGTRRGWASGTAVRTQKSVHVPLRDAAGPWAEVARRVAGWGGKLPPPGELAWLLGRVRARIALIRHGDTIQAWGRQDSGRQDSGRQDWGRMGRAEAPHLLGGDAGVAPVGEVGRVLGLAAERVRAWSDRAPDPDLPLLVEDPALRAGRKGETDRATKWWVYAAIGGALAASATILLVHDSAGDRQRVELHYP